MISEPNAEQLEILDRYNKNLEKSSNSCKLKDLEPLLKRIPGFDKEIERIKRFELGNPTAEDIEDLLEILSRSKI